MLFRDKTGRILDSSSVDKMYYWEIEDLGIHVFVDDEEDLY
jgi:hypothetical protein